MHITRLLRPALPGLIALFAMAAPPAHAEEIQVKLSGAQEVPPINTTATGNASVTIDQERRVSGKLTTSGVNASMAHIHQGKTGSNGPAIVTLDKSGENAWLVPAGTRLNEAQFKAFQAGELYLNVHSPTHKDGEIRGQLVSGK